MSEENNDSGPEDSMEPMELEAEETNFVPVNNTANSPIQNMLSDMITLSKGEAEEKIIVEPSCPICMSPFRAEAEELWEENRSVSELKKFFKEKTGLKLSADVIRNHMDNHVRSGIKEIQKAEYLARLKRLQCHNPSTMNYLDLSLTVLSERLMGINSITPSGGETDATIEKIKSAETAKIAAQIQSIAKTRAALLGEMMDNGEIIQIPAKDFTFIFSAALGKCVTDNEKQIVKFIIDRFSMIRQ